MFRTASFRSPPSLGKISIPQSKYHEIPNPLASMSELQSQLKILPVESQNIIRETNDKFMDLIKNNPQRKMAGGLPAIEVDLDFWQSQLQPEEFIKFEKDIRRMQGRIAEIEKDNPRHQEVIQEVSKNFQDPEETTTLIEGLHKEMSYLDAQLRQAAKEMKQMSETTPRQHFEQNPEFKQILDDAYINHRFGEKYDTVEQYEEALKLSGADKLVPPPTESLVDLIRKNGLVTQEPPLKEKWTNEDQLVNSPEIPSLEEVLKQLESHPEDLRKEIEEGFRAIGAFDVEEK